MARLFKTSIQFFLQHQGQEAAEHMAPDRFVTLEIFGTKFWGRPC
jgi:hypothetical protein